MKKSVNLYYENHTNAKDKLKQIKINGFDEFFTGVYDDFEKFSIKQQCDYAKKLGLDCTMIHCKYNEPNLHYFWEYENYGDLICDDYCNQIKSCKGLTQNFVVHLNGTKGQAQSEIGLQRIQKMLEVCEDCNINLCIENLYSETEIPFIFDNIKHKHLKICLDVGHHHFLTPNFDIINKYYQHIEVLHLHDNHGTADEHLVCGEGTIDWKLFAKDLKHIPNIVLSAEVKSKSDNDKLLKEIYQSLQMIEELSKKEF